MFINKEKLKEEAAGKWLDILEALTHGEFDDAIDNLGRRHVDCPLVHGGADDFRFFPDADESGKAICTCGSYDVLQLLMEINSWTFPETLKQVHSYLYGSAVGKRETF